MRRTRPATSPAARGGTSGSHLPEWQGDRKWRRCCLVLGPEEGTRAGTRPSGSSERLKRNPPTPQPLRAPHGPSACVSASWGPRSRGLVVTGGTRGRAGIVRPGSPPPRRPGPPRLLGPRGPRGERRSAPGFYFPRSSEPPTEFEIVIQISLLSDPFFKNRMVTNYGNCNRGTP